MKRFFQTLSCAFIVGLAVALVSCDKKDNGKQPDPSGAKKIEYLNATAYDKWVYFSFAKGMEVKVEDPAKSLEWDAAFCRNQVRVNAATGYSGKGGVVMTETEDFASKFDVNTLQFKGNTEGMIKLESGMGLQPGQKPRMEMQAFVNEGTPNTFTLFTINMKNMQQGAAAMYPVRKNIFLFKSADGNTIYKFRMTASVNAKGQLGGTLSFEYEKL